ncbi:hypothetical protein [Myxococcus stipitatus]|uniref:hypothetical protein n=1 Tax=Myxococcus stipitatus TaxID=83455 RepID=UPI0030CD050F
MNFIGILGSTTDVLKTGGVGTCVAIAIQYRQGQSPYQYALAHVPYDGDALAKYGQKGVDNYVDALFLKLGNPDAMSIRVIENTANKMTAMITQKLDAHHDICDYKVSSYRNLSLPRMNVVILRQPSARFGRLFCYASDKTEFIDESMAASDASSKGMNLISEMDVQTRDKKHNFRRHADLYAKARQSLGTQYSQAKNPYTLALLESNAQNFLPVLADTDTFTRTKRDPWTKKHAKPAFTPDYLTWENRIASKVLNPPPQPWSGV